MISSHSNKSNAGGTIRFIIVEISSEVSFQIKEKIFIVLYIVAYVFAAPLNNCVAFCFEFLFLCLNTIWIFSI